MEMFRSRLGLLTASLGMAIGTGNIWRFPRKVAQYHGSAYIMVWLVGLVVWSIPLLLVEAGIGRSLKRSVPFAFENVGGRTFMSLGVFIALVTTLIMFYYTVVTGWCTGYTIKVLLNGIPNDPASYWQGFNGSLGALVWTVVIAAIAGMVVFRGIENGIERLSLVLMPVLFFLLIVLAFYAAFLPGASMGFERVFGLDPGTFKDPTMWIDAISQSAWSTGAGWGLYMTYSSYAGSRTGLEATTYATGFGNNLASMLAATAIIPMVLTVLPGPQAERYMASGNTGLAFVAVPLAFNRIGGITGRIVGLAFFAGLLFAALSSLIAMFEMDISILRDMGITRKKAAILVTGVTMVLAAPSAVFPWFFNNQDWTWGIALLISGMMLALLVIRTGPSQFVSRFLPDLSPSSKYLVRGSITVMVPAIFLTLVTWYLVTAALDTKTHPWSLHNPYSITWTLLEWTGAGILSWGTVKVWDTRNNRSKE